MTILERLARMDRTGNRLGRHSVMLASLVLMLVALPLLQWLPARGARFPMLLGVVLLAAIFVNSTRRSVLWAAIVVGIGGVAVLSYGHATGSMTARIVGEVLGLVLLGATTLVILVSLVRSRRVDVDTVVGGICVYLLIGVSFSVIYRVLIDLAPNAILAGGIPLIDSPEDASSLPARLVYFSFVTLTTVGYGDITPQDELAQMLAASEAAIGQLYLAIFIARLMGLYMQPDPAVASPGSMSPSEHGSQDRDA